jgi:hypothetical protein
MFGVAVGQARPDGYTGTTSLLHCTQSRNTYAPGFLQILQETACNPLKLGA